MKLFLKDNKDFFDIKINPYHSFEEFRKESLKKSASLPESVRLKLHELVRYGNKDGYLLFPKIALEDKFLKTPEDHKDAQQKEKFVSESVLSIFGSYLGTIYAYKQESNASFFNNIRPTIRNKNEQSSESSDIFLELHTEIAFHEIVPDFLLLYCIKSDRNKEAKTGISSIRNALSHLSCEEIEELFKCQYKIGVDFSFRKNKNNTNAYKNISILSGSKSDPYMVYDADMISCDHTEGQQALLKLDKLLRENMRLVKMEEGDLIIIDNRRTIHSRTGFTAYFDGQDRWLQRSFVKICPLTAERFLSKSLDVVTIAFD